MREDLGPTTRRDEICQPRRNSQLPEDLQAKAVLQYQRWPNCGYWQQQIANVSKRLGDTLSLDGKARLDAEIDHMPEGITFMAAYYRLLNFEVRERRQVIVA